MANKYLDTGHVEHCFCSEKAWLPGFLPPLGDLVAFVRVFPQHLPNDLLKARPPFAELEILAKQVLVLAPGPQAGIVHAPSEPWSKLLRRDYVGVIWDPCQRATRPLYKEF